MAKLWAVSTSPAAVLPTSSACRTTSMIGAMVAPPITPSVEASSSTVSEARPVR